MTARSDGDAYGNQAMTRHRAGENKYACADCGESEYSSMDIVSWQCAGVVCERFEPVYSAIGAVLAGVAIPFRAVAMGGGSLCRVGAGGVGLAARCAQIQNTRADFSGGVGRVLCTKRLC